MRIQRGLTLLEMLAVLVLVGLISTLLLQGLSFVLQLRGRLLNEIALLRDGALQEYWFRSTTAGAIPDDVLTPEHTFHGDAHGFSGLTLASLDDDPGVPVPFAWRLDEHRGDFSLSYQGRDDKPQEILRWRGQRGEFRYLDAAGQWQDQWPPAQGIAPLLPRGVLLAAETDGEPWVWFAELPNRNEVKPDPRYMLLD
jgi:general secretion pathway protein J